MTTAIEVEGLTKEYAGTTVVRDVSFMVAHGEIFGIIGPNGAGKSTTVECIEGLRKPDAGHISVLGLDPVRDRDELRERLGVQLQDAELPGLWLPIAAMPAVLRHVSHATPLGAAVQAMTDAWPGHWHPLYLLILAGYAVVFAGAAASLFRWE
jgi:ABC-type glutathione transport system ATPase component